MPTASEFLSSRSVPFVLLLLAGCSSAAVSLPVADAGLPPDASQPSDDAGARSPDAWVVDPASDAGPRSPEGCFAAPLTLGEFHGRYAVRGITALEDGWLVSQVGSSDGHELMFLDAAGRTRATASESIGPLLRLGPTSFAHVAGHQVERVDIVDDHLIRFPPVTIGIAWGSILTTDADATLGRLRVLSYDPEPGDVFDLRLEVTELVLSETVPSGLSARAGRAGPSLTSELGIRLGYGRYALRGEMLRVFGDLHERTTILVELSLGALGTDEELAYRVLERGAWEAPPGVYDVVGLTSDGSRMVVARLDAHGELTTYVEALPGHEGGGAVGEIGPGRITFFFDEILGVVAPEQVRILSDLDLRELAVLPITGQFAGAARRGDDVAILTTNVTREATTLQLRCVSVGRR